MGLGHYKWYQSKTPGDVPTKRLSSKRYESVCQQGRWVPKVGGFGGVPHGLEKGMSASKDTTPRSGVDCEILRRFGRRMEHSLYKDVETSP